MLSSAREPVSINLRSAKLSCVCRQEGFHAFYKGITPRIMRVAPGQAVTFTVYEFLKDKLEKSGPLGLSGNKFEE
jgi:solute carrier family 25 citrate transporter 1